MEKHKQKRPKNAFIFIKSNKMFSSIILELLMLCLGLSKIELKNLWNYFYFKMFLKQQETYATVKFELLKTTEVVFITEMVEICLILLRNLYKQKKIVQFIAIL